MTSTNTPPPQIDRGSKSAPAAARLTLNGTIKPNEGEKLPSLNRLNNPNIPVGSFEDKNSPRLVNTNAGFFSGGDGTANAAIGVGVNAKAVTFSLGSVLSTGLLSSIDSKRSDYDVDESILDNAKELVNRVTDRLQTVAREGSIKDYYKKLVEPREKINKDLGTTPVSPILPRFFEDRSYLIFFSPEIKIILPFFQNPTIEEKRLINYTMTTQQGQAPIVNYNFTNLAEIKVSFKINYRHVSEILSKEGLDVNQYSFYSINEAQERVNDASKFFIRSQETSTNSPNGLLQIYKDILKTEKKQFNDKFDKALLQNIVNFDKDENRKRSLELTNYDETSIFGLFGRTFEDSVSKAQALCLMWIYTIKSWVSNPATGSGFGLDEISTQLTKAIDATKNVAVTTGPLASAGSEVSNKLIIIKHGPAFYYIPGILISYDIKESSNTPYDLATVMANSFDVNLTILGRPNDYLFTFTELGTGRISNETPENLIINRAQ